MRHQVERLKHVAPRQGVKLARALTAAFVAIGMMVTGSVVLSSSTANADDGHNNGAICTPTTEPLGDQTSGSGNDEGIATFVGGDMYVGGKKSGITSADNKNAPEGSYAVEAEGLTAVNGKLLLHPMKQAWNIWKNGSFDRSRGFRWGIVGFGSQFRPKDGSTVLSVGGNSTNSELNWFGGAQGWTDNSTQGSSWLGTGVGNGATGETNDHNFSANIAGNQTTVQSRNGWKNGEQYSVYAMGGNGKVNWNHSNTVISGVKNPSTGSDYTYSDYKNYVATLSGKLAKIASSNTVTRGNEDNYTGYRYSYSYNTYEHNVYRFDIQNNSRQTEITLTGNGKDELQVFNLDASMLNSIGDAGVVFNFKNISDNASVAININGNGNDVKFRNGWQFKWNDVDISDGYVMMKSTGTNRYNNTHGQEYVKRASQLMWNFYNTNTLTILGGKGSGHINTGWYKNQNHGDKEDWYDVNVTDDPSAAWMGSVMVTGNDSGAAGNFQSHVSTNGRVWTTGDFEMYNKDVVTTGSGNFVNAEGKYSTSAVDMDQERHNLPWYGQMTTSCAAIRWDKVDAGGTALKGTSWTVYGTKDDAVSGTTTPITTVADGGWNDADNADNGSVTLGSLAKNATYYVRESGTGSSKYALNTNIYRIVTQDSTDTVSTIDKVYTAGGDDITAKDGDAKQLNNGAIVNVNAGPSIAWSKVDAGDQNALLAGSTWELTKKGNPAQSWTITDDDSDSEIANIVVKINKTEVSSWNFTNSTPVSISYVAVDKNGKELTTKVQWKSETPAVAGIAGDGTQLQPYSDGTTNIVFTAGDKTLTFPVAVKGVTVESRISIERYTEGQEISLEQGKTMTLKATVQPEGNTVNWSSSNTDDVSVSPSTGTAVTVTAKNATSSYVTITATEQRGEKKASLKIKVTEPMVSVYFKKSNVQWNNYWLKYRKSTDGTGWSGDVQSSSACGDYVRFQLPKSSVATDREFYLGNAQGWNLTANNIYQAVNKSNFRFTGDSVQVVETYNNYRGSTVPSGCTVTSAYVENRSRRSAVKNAVFYDQPVVRAITNTTDKAAGTLQDEDPKTGQLKVSNLTDGTYTLEETSAPNGFDASKANPYTIVIKNGLIESSNLPGKVENPRLTGKVTWRKTAENTSKLLSGSEWKLYKTKNFTWNNGNAEYTEGDSITPIATITDCVNSREKTCSAQTKQYTDRDGDAGKFELVGLAWGEYQLVESKAPAGYNIDSNPHTFRIGPAEGSDVTGKWYTSSGFHPEATAAYNESTAFTIDGGPITNTAGVVLPDTGGEGVNKMYAAGFLAVAIAMVGLALSLKRRQS